MIKNMVSILGLGMMILVSNAQAEAQPTAEAYCGRVEEKIFNLGAPTKFLVLSYPYVAPKSSIVLMGQTPDVAAKLASFDPSKLGANLMFCAYAEGTPSPWAFGLLLKIRSFSVVPWMP